MSTTQHYVQDNSCMEVFSADFKSSDASACIQECSDCFAKLQKGAPGTVDADFPPEKLLELKKVFLALGEAALPLAAAEFRHGDTTTPVTARGGGFVRDLLRRCGMSDEAAAEYEALLPQFIQALQDSPKESSLSRFADLLQVVLGVPAADLERNFRVRVSPLTEDKYTWHGWQLCLWCFSPAVAVQSLADTGIRSMILTSGTLSPMHAVASELGVPFPVQLQNQHVVPSENVLGCILERGPNTQVELSSTRAKRCETYYLELGHIIENLCRVVPGGILAFFPSFSMLDACHAMWKNGSIVTTIEKYKVLVVEQKGAKGIQDSLAKYDAQVTDPRSPGAVFLAVYRGKVSEGIDFSDHHARAVVIIGVPFPNSTDPKVQLKKKYQDELKRQWLASNGGGGSAPPLCGSEWYARQALVPVNQAVGRVIRHRRDFGAVILCDGRYKQSEYKDALSGWLHSSLKPYSFGPLISELAQFFKRHNQRYLQERATAAPTAAAPRQSPLLPDMPQLPPTTDTPPKVGLARPGATAAPAGTPPGGKKRVNSPYRSPLQSHAPDVKNPGLEFLEQVKAALSERQMCEFRALLREFKRSTGTCAGEKLSLSTVDELASRMKKLLRSDELWRGFMNNVLPEKIQSYVAAPPRKKKRKSSNGGAQAT
eukprot:TRINITY_DN988_c0_g1_i4.p1 TRINITY_DN988_c0_g1~~TRINITY_DN988_c0_g1_i4.p1  ORF type:complete len:655 (-),score=135.20 TRINITY_DN988_c0_g1_i4:1282-3246(-)